MTICVWEVRSQKLVTRLEGHTGTVVSQHLCVHVHSTRHCPRVRFYNGSVNKVALYFVPAYCARGPQFS